jgi:hypothetical protein
MTKPEVRSPKEIRMTNGPFTIVIRHSFGLLTSDFVIPPGGRFNFSADHKF